jgi:2-haloacid dehalogenase
MSLEVKPMSPDRREFLSRMGVSGLALQSLTKKSQRFRSNFKAFAFHGFPILDPRPVFTLVNELYPERGVELRSVWRTRQFGSGSVRIRQGRLRVHVREKCIVLLLQGNK